MLHRKKKTVILVLAHKIFSKEKKKGHWPASHFAPIVLKARAHNQKNGQPLKINGWDALFETAE